MKRLIILLVVMWLLFATISLATAQTGGGYDLTWSTIDNGGGASAGGGYTLNGTIGQPDAGTALAGGGYTLVGGFWGGARTPYRVYLPLIVRD
jgi:hypothetical protein